MNQDVIFIESAVQHEERFYCNRCFYNEEKNEKLDKYPKPKETKCYIGSRGYYRKLNVSK